VKNDRPVQKFEYVFTASKGQSSGPGYRCQLATYNNVHSAADDKLELADAIYTAYQSGGDFVRDEYYQYQNCSFTGRFESKRRF